MDEATRPTLKPKTKAIAARAGIVARAAFVIPVTLRVWASSGHSWWELVVWVAIAAAIGAVYGAIKEIEAAG